MKIRFIDGRQPDLADVDFFTAEHLVASGKAVAISGRLAPPEPEDPPIPEAVPPAPPASPTESLATRPTGKRKR